MASALKTWELENAVSLIDPSRDALYDLDIPGIKAENEARPWKENPHHFQHIRISAVALLKMVMHARSGGSLEIMGLMQGYISGGTFVVTDAFRLPVEGTETRVNAGAEADEYMVQYLQRARDVGQLENAVGWYHSHPGYGCWLSGIDVSTQMLQQTHNDPFVAVVIDPDRTISAGKVEIGAFRTYPDGYTPANGGGGGGGGGEGESDETIPLAKIDDFGAHAARYYSLEVSHFKSSLDTRLIEALWNKYWVGTLSASPLLSNRDYGTKQITELAQKIRQANTIVKTKSNSGPNMGRVGAAAGGRGKDGNEALNKIVRAGNKIAAEEKGGLLASDIKAKLFCGVDARPANHRHVANNVAGFAGGRGPSEVVDLTAKITNVEDALVQI